MFFLFITQHIATLLFFTLLFLGASCSSVRESLPPDPTAPAQENLAKHTTPPQKDTIDPLSGSAENTRLSTGNEDAWLHTPGTQRATGVNLVIDSTRCLAFFHKTQEILKDHVYFKSFDDLPAAWETRMMKHWLHTFDAKSLYWTAKEKKALSEFYQKDLAQHFKNKNCRMLETILGNWLEKKHQLNQSFYDFLAKGSPLLLSHEDSLLTAMQSDLDFLRQFALPYQQESLLLYVKEHYKKFLKAHAQYDLSDLIHLSLQAFVGSLDEHSSYGLGAYGSSHTYPSYKKVISLADHWPLLLLPLGNGWMFLSKKLAPISHSASKSTAKEQKQQKLAGSRLVQILNSEQWLPEQHLGIPVDLLDHRRAQAHGLPLDMKIVTPDKALLLSEQPLDSQTQTFSLIEKHQEEEEESGIESSLYEYQDYTKDQKLTLAVLTLPTLHSHDKGKTLYLELAEALSTISQKDRTAPLVIDLRGNNEGSLETAVNLLTLFTRYKLSLHYSSSKQDLTPMSFTRTYMSSLPPVWDNPIVLLVNSQTGGASEYFSHHLQKEERAIIVGGPITEGYGSSQKYIAKHESWSGYFITDKVFRYQDGSTWNCQGLNLDVSWLPLRKTLSPFFVSPPQKDCSLEIVGTPSHSQAFIEMKTALAQRSSRRLQQNSSLSEENRDLEEASQIALDYSFLSNQLTPGRYRLIKDTTDSSSLHWQEPSADKEPSANNKGSSAEREMSAEVTKTAAQQKESAPPKGFLASLTPHVFATQLTSETVECPNPSTVPPAYTLSIDETEQGDFRFLICHGTGLASNETISNPDQMGESSCSMSITDHDMSCVNAFRDASDTPVILSYNDFGGYGYQEAVEDSEGFLAKVYRNREEQRLLYKSFGMGLLGGSVSGAAAASHGVIAGIAGSTIVDSTMDAAAGVPGKVDENVGTPKVAAIASTGTATGTAASIASLVFLRKLLLRVLPQTLSSSPWPVRIAAAVLVILGVKFAFFSDAEKMSQNPLHPFSWFADLVWEDASIELATAWPQLLQGNSSPNLSEKEMILALQTLKELLTERGITSSSTLMSYCLNKTECAPL